jgi:hypothetical protein
MKKTMIIYERLINAKFPPKKMTNSIGATRNVPYGTWFRKHYPDKFREMYNKWVAKEE